MRLPNGTGIPFNHAALDLDGAPQRVYHACELDQQPVTDNSNDAPVVFLYCRLDKDAAMGLPLGEGTFLIRLNEPAVPSDIGRQNGG
jgi:hypothetical protein